MLAIHHGMKPTDINSLLQRHGITEVNINIESVNNDINKLKDELNSDYIKTMKNKRIHMENLKRTLHYLEKIVELANKSDGKLNISWIINDNIIKSIPFEIMDILEYNIMTMDYIVLDKNIKLFSINYRSLADIIAFEIMYRDLDETLDSIEDKLSDLGIIAIYDSKEITKYFEESPYTLSKILKITDSPYIVHNNKLIQDYFYTKSFKINYYKEVVGYSCRVAMTIIAEDLLKEAIQKGLGVKLGGIVDTGLYLMVDNKDVERVRNAIKSISLRAFGRRFEIKPKVTVY